jgi:hypothetical protein
MTDATVQVDHNADEGVRITVTGEIDMDNAAQVEQKIVAPSATSSPTSPSMWAGWTTSTAPACGCCSPSAPASTLCRSPSSSSSRPNHRSAE